MTEREIVARLAAMGPIVRDGRMTSCVFCYRATSGTTFIHSDHCLWARAVELIKETS